MLIVSDLMTVDPMTVTPTTPLGNVLELMQTEQYRQLPVLNSHGKLVGIITDRDVRLALNSPLVVHEKKMDDKLLATYTTQTCMTPDPITVAPDTTAVRAAEMLLVYKFGALPVIDDGVLVGIISTTDFLNYFVDQSSGR